LLIDLFSLTFVLSLCKIHSGSLIQTNDNETRCLHPIGLQQDVDTAVRSTMGNDSGQCFVRPSGTENVARVYAEAATQEQVDQLAQCAARLVTKHCGTPTEAPRGADYK
jgi:phosphoacetylglucosamine mutase